MAWRNVSKFRNVRGTFYQNDATYPELRVSDSSSDGRIISASALFFAFCWTSNTGGTLGVLKHSQYGKRQGPPPLIHAHSAQINDLEWNPFHDWTLATVSSDCYAKIWLLPEEGLTSDLTEASVTLKGHKKRINGLAWNPTSDNILATGSMDETVRVWDAATGDEKLSQNIGVTTYGLSWNYDGSLLAATCKDSKLRILDPRASSVVSEVQAHAGNVQQRACWMGKEGKIITTGSNRMRIREWSVWDAKKLDKPLQTTKVGTGTGALHPLYDIDTKLLWVTGRGDSGIRVYETLSDSPYVKELSGVMSKDPHRGVCMVPKRALHVMGAEVMRLLKVTKNAVLPIGFKVPRKSYADFHEELFPDTAGPDAAQTAADWLGGQNKEPKLISLKPDNASTPAPAGETRFSSPVKIDPRRTMNPSTIGRKARPLTKTITQSQDGTIVGDDDDDDYFIPKEVRIVRSSSFRHIFGKPFNRTECYDNLRVENNAIHAHSIRMNSKYFATPWTGNGGRIGVIGLGDTGRLPSTTTSVLETGSLVYDFDFNPFDEDMIAVGLENAHTKVYKIPEGGILKRDSNYNECAIDLRGHYNKVVTVDFHPTASNVLVTGSGDMTIKLWDLNTGDEKLTLEGFGDMPASNSWNQQGTKVVASCKDTKLRVFDARQTKCILEVPDFTGAKPSAVAWLGATEKFLASGFAKGSSTRSAMIYDTRSPDKPIANVQLNSGSSVLTPYYDADTGVVVFAAKGDGNILFYEITNAAPGIHRLTEYNTSTPQLGLAMTPKRSLDVKQVELFRIYKITKNSCEPISFKVPRTRKEFFQDDIFPPCIDHTCSISANDWFSGKDLTIKRVSLQPKGMKPLSQAPKIIRKVRKYNPDEDQQMDMDDIKEKVLNKFHDKIQEWNEDETSNLPGEDLSGCDSDEWSD